MTKSQNRMETDLQADWLNFIENLYFTIVDLFCRYKSDNNMNITYNNRLWRCPWSLIGKKDIAPCAYNQSLCAYQSSGLA